MHPRGRNPACQGVRWLGSRGSTPPHACVGPNVLAEVGVDGADVEVGTAGGDPVVDLVDLQFQTAFEVSEGHLRPFGSACGEENFL